MRPSKTAAYAAAAPTTGRPHAITVFGCTGNAGRAVAYHAAKSAATKRPAARLALAGRNQAKIEGVLEGIRAELHSEGIAADDMQMEIVIADLSDEQSMLELAQSTNVLVACAGPYGRFGEPVVKACVEAGTHYLDITGEWEWVERMIAEYGDKAEKSGVALCPFAGYDCVPSELAMELVGSALAMDGGAKLGDLQMNFGSKGGGFPRGTLFTILDMADGSKPERKAGTPRFYPKEYRSTFKATMAPSRWLLPKYQLGQFTAQNFMSVVNTPVLCRAAPILGIPSDVSISDRSTVTGRPSLLNGYGLLPAQAFIAVLISGAIAFALPPIRGYIRSKLQNGYNYHGDPAGRTFVHARGVSTDKKSSASTQMKFPGDPGIYATGVFAASVANALNEATAAGSKFAMPLAGFNSPVAALHKCRPGLLVEHLRELGAEINVEVVPEGSTTKKVDAAQLRSKL
ncbi:hypothetical protein ACHAXT_010820 [Thalassiosira profunda]